jgi:hypothetical protein
MNVIIVALRLTIILKAIRKLVSLRPPFSYYRFRSEMLSTKRLELLILEEIKGHINGP